MQSPRMVRTLHPFRRPGATFAATVASIALSLPVNVHAAPFVTLQADQALRFGSFVVLGSGTRTVTATGTVSDSGIFPVSGTSRGPSQLTLTYHRGAPPTGPVTVTVLLNLVPPAPVSQNGLVATVTSFDTDLPGIPQLTPGQGILFTMPVCSTQVCTHVFHVGGRISVTRPGTGGAVTVPLTVTASLVSVQ